MAIDLGDGVFRVAADLSQFRQDMSAMGDEASSAIGDVAGEFKSLSRTASTVGAVVAGALVAVGFEAIRNADNLATMAVQTGISTDALQRLDFAARQNSSSIDTVVRASNRLDRELGNVQDGTEPLVASLGELGLNFHELQAMTPDERFRAVGFALGEMDDATRAARIGNDIFGRSFLELLPLFSMGEQAYQDMTRELRISSDEQIAAGVEANAAWIDLTWQFEQMRLEVGTAVLPVLMELFDIVQPIIESTIDWIRENEELTATIAGVALKVGALMAALFPIIATIGTIAATLKSLFVIAAGFKVLAGLALAASAAIATISAPVLAVIGAIGLLVFAIVGVIGAWDEMKEGASIVFEFLKDAVVATGQVFVNAFRAMAEVSIGVWRAIRDAFTSVWNGILEFFGGVWDAMIAVVMRAIEAIMRPIMMVVDAIGMIGGLLGGAFGFGGGDSVQALARGGVVNRPFQIVGEEGPELAALPQGSRVFNARDTSDMMGGGDTNFNAPLIHVDRIDAGNQGDVDMFLDRAGRMLSDRLSRAGHRPAYGV